MCRESLIRRIAGVFVLASLALGWWVHPAWLLFTAFVALNLFQSSVTGLCPLERILGRARMFGCTAHPRAGSHRRA
jgi:hypothetical protein